MIERRRTILIVMLTVTVLFSMVGICYFPKTFSQTLKDYKLNVSGITSNEDFEKTGTGTVTYVIFDNHLNTMKLGRDTGVNPTLTIPIISEPVDNAYIDFYMGFEDFTDLASGFYLSDADNWACTIQMKNNELKYYNEEGNPIVFYNGMVPNVLYHFHVEFDALNGTSVWMNGQWMITLPNFHTNEIDRVVFYNGGLSPGYSYFDAVGCSWNGYTAFDNWNIPNSNDPSQPVYPLPPGFRFDILVYIILAVSISLIVGYLFIRYKKSRKIQTIDEPSLEFNQNLSVKSDITTHLLPNLLKLAKTTKKIRMDEAADFLNISRNELLQHLIDNNQNLNFVINGDFLEFPAENEINDFVEILDRQFQTWNIKSKK